MNSSITHYKLILRGIFDATPIVPQTSTLDGRPVTSLTSNYLCLQCPSTVTEEERLRHGTKKQHRFCWLPSAASWCTANMAQMSTREVAAFIVRYATTISGIQLSRSYA